jgi:hypothetical protein
MNLRQHRVITNEADMADIFRYEEHVLLDSGIPRVTADNIWLVRNELVRTGYASMYVMERTEENEVKHKRKQQTPLLFSTREIGVRERKPVTLTKSRKNESMVPLLNLLLLLVIAAFFIQPAEACGYACGEFYDASTGTYYDPNIRVDRDTRLGDSYGAYVQKYGTPHSQTPKQAQKNFEEWRARGNYQRRLDGMRYRHAAPQIN